MLIEKTGHSEYIKNYSPPSLSSSSSSSRSSDIFSSLTFDDFPESLLNLEELTFSMFDSKKIPSQTILKIKQKIEFFHSEGKIFGCLLKKIMSITHHIHEENNDALLKELSLNAFAEKIDEYNVYYCLNDAYKMNCQVQIKVCLNFIEKVSLLKLQSSGPNLIITVTYLNISFEQISTAILNLSKIYDSKVFIRLSPTYLNTNSLLENFLKENGELLHSLVINENIMKVSDSFFEKIITYCPNIAELSIKSSLLKGTALKKLHRLKNLISLNLSWCINLTELGNNYPLSLKKINFSHCTKIERIESLPEELLKLNVQYCINLKSLPPSLSKSVRVKSLDCWKLNDSSVS